MNAYHRTIAVCIATGLMLVGSGSTSAGTVTFTDLTEGIPTAAFADFPSGITVPGFGFGPGPTCDIQVIEEVRCLFTYQSAATSTAATEQNYTIGLYDDAGVTVLSDVTNVFRIFFPAGAFADQPAFEYLQIDFRSDGCGDCSNPDPSNGFGFGPQAVTAIETGGMQSFDIPSVCSGCTDLTVVLQSDVGSAPEPATLALVGLGLAGMRLMRRRHPGRLSGLTTCGTRGHRGAGRPARVATSSRTWAVGHRA